MDWFQNLNNYCERQTSDFWGEPVNALTNLIFVLVGFVLAFKTKKDNLCLCLSVQIIFIGVASFIFHTFANRLSALLDVACIIFFGITYIFGVNLRFLNTSYLVAILLATLLIPFSFVISFLTVITVGEINGSSWYISFVVLFLMYSFLLKNVFPNLSRALFYCAPFFVVSIILRSTDFIVCNSIPLGTHFIWHIMNSFLLGALVWFFYKSAKINL